MLMAYHMPASFRLTSGKDVHFEVYRDGHKWFTALAVDGYEKFRRGPFKTKREAQDVAIEIDATMELIAEAKS